MLKKVRGAMALFAGLVMVPSLALAEVSLSEMVDETVLEPSVGVFDGSGDGVLGQPAPRPRPRPGYLPAPPPPSRPVVVRPVAVRPVAVRPVVVATTPTTVVVNSDASTSSEKPTKTSSDRKFGFGLRVNGFLQGPTAIASSYSKTYSNRLTEVETRKISGGVGYYLKYRPVRWVSVEFQNDILWGAYDLPAHDNFKNFVRVPLDLGLRVHVFDYGALDVYGVAAAAMTFTTIDDGRSDVSAEVNNFQFGGQFGAGVSFLMSCFEIGLDVRYTVDQAPDELRSSFYQFEVDHSDAVHGFLFSLNIGFAL